MKIILTWTFVSILLVGCSDGERPANDAPSSTPTQIVSPLVPQNPGESLVPYEIQAFSSPSASSEYFPDTGQYKARNAIDTYLGAINDHADYVMWRPKPWDAAPWIAFEWLEPVYVHAVSLYDHPQVNKRIRSGVLTIFFVDGSSTNYAIGTLVDNGQTAVTIDVKDASLKLASKVQISITDFQSEIGVSEVLISGVRAPTRTTFASSINLAPYARVSDVSSTLNPHYANTDAGDFRGYFAQDGDNETYWLSNNGDTHPSLTFTFDLPYCVKSVELFDIDSPSNFFTEATLEINGTTTLQVSKLASTMSVVKNLPTGVRSAVQKIKITLAGGNSNYFMGLMDVKIMSCDGTIITDTAVSSNLPDEP